MQDHEQRIATAKMGGGAALAGTTALTLNEWVAVVTICYFVLQIGLLMPKYWKLYKDWRAK